MVSGSCSLLFPLSKLDDPSLTDFSRYPMTHGVSSMAHRLSFLSSNMPLDVPMMEDCTPPIEVPDLTLATSTSVCLVRRHAPFYFGSTPSFCAVRQAYADVGHGSGGGGGVKQLQGKTYGLRKHGSMESPYRRRCWHTLG